MNIIPKLKSIIIDVYKDRNGHFVGQGIKIYSWLWMEHINEFKGFTVLDNGNVEIKEMPDPSVIIEVNTYRDKEISRPSMLEAAISDAERRIGQHVLGEVSVHGKVLSYCYILTQGSKIIKWNKELEELSKVP